MIGIELEATRQTANSRTWFLNFDLCFFAATASIVSALLKSPFFSEFFDRDDYRRADGLAGLIGALSWL
jgi:hypothetical protein